MPSSKIIKSFLTVALCASLTGFASVNKASAAAKVPSAPLKSGSLLFCSERGGRVSLWNVNLKTGRRTKIFERKSIIHKGTMKFYSPSGVNDCVVTVSANLQWEVGTDAIYRGDIVKRNIRSGKITRLPYPDNSSDFYSTDIYTLAYTNCGSGNGSVYTLASDGWLYRQKSSRLVKMAQITDDPEGNYRYQSTFLSCLNGQVMLGLEVNGNGGGYLTYFTASGSEVSTDQYGGPCWSLLYSDLGECPRAADDKTPRWYARVGDNRYFLFVNSSGIGIWGCTDNSAFASCDPKLLVRNLPIDFNPYFTRIQGFAVNGRMTILISQQIN